MFLVLVTVVVNWLEFLCPQFDCLLSLTWCKLLGYIVNLAFCNYHLALALFVFSHLVLLVGYGI